jgi:hypothetical protein
MDPGADPIPTNERYVYEVPSDRQPTRRYRVDLVANAGAGWCSCTDFATRKQPALDAGGEPFTRQCSCKHLRKTWRYFLRAFFTRAARQE